MGINHLDTRAVRRPGTTFDQSNPRRRYRRSTVRPDSPDGQVFSATLDLLGDRVTVSVLAAATLGMSRFGDMQRELGISPYLLSERLRGFVDNRVMARVPIADGARRQEYRLLPKGLDILPVFVMINEWANRWYPDPEGPALTIVHRACGQPIEPRWSCNACGEYLTMRTIHYTE